MSDPILYDRRIFAENLLRLMRERQERQIDLARLLNVSKSTVSSYCSAQQLPRMDKIEQLALHYGVSRAALLGDDTSPAPAPEESPLSGLWKVLNPAGQEELLRYGMRFYEPYTAFKQGQALATKEVRLGDRDSISIGTLNDVSLVVPINSVSRLKAEYSLDQKNLTAPIKKGAKIGVLNLSLDGKVIYKTNLVSLDEVNEGGFFSRTWDHIVIFFKDLF